MNPRGVTSVSLLAILLLVLIVRLPISNRVRAMPSFSFVLYDHGLAKGFVYGRHTSPVNKTDSFTQDDNFVYAYFKAAVDSAAVTWLWYDPSGQLFLNRTQQIGCDIEGVAACYFIYYFPVKYTSAATNFGEWTLIVQVNGNDLYSDHFSISPIVNQDNSWRFDVVQSAPARVHGYLTVTIHPHNGTWSSYLIYMPFAANVTAYDAGTNRTLEVNLSNSTGVTRVDLGAARPDGYTFGISFDLAYGVWGSLGEWYSNYFVFEWQESSWGTFGDGYHPIPSTFEITLPRDASFVDAVGINDLALNQNVTGGLRPTMSLVKTLAPAQTFGWVILYRDVIYSNTNPQPVSNSNYTSKRLSAAQAQPIPILPMTVGSFSVWSAVMSIVLLTASERLTPVYAGTGVVINRRRLRIAAVVLVVLFLAASAYQVIAISQSVSVAGH